MTQCPLVRTTRPLAAALLLLLVPCPSFSQTEEFRLYTEHPRLLLTRQRLRLLKRERERQSMRWQQFEAMIKSGVKLAEPGFAWALYHAVTGDAAAGKRAAQWAVEHSTDTRQSAFVFDWCQDTLSAEQATTIGGALRQVAGAALSPGASVVAARDRALAAAAVADLDADGAERAMRAIVLDWWRKREGPELERGKDLDPGAETFALLELLHVLRDNLKIDLRSDAPGYFRNLPQFQVASNYPAPYPGSENDFYIPAYREQGPPDLRRAALARAAGLSLVAYDNNTVENQYLQGWLMQDRFQLRGAFGAPYEFLWANPYQPGLSYEHLPLNFYDPRSGTLFLRSSWDDDAVWFALVGGEAQIFRNGKLTVLTRQTNAAGQVVHVGDSAVLLARDPMRFRAATHQTYILGGKPHGRYDVEVDDEEMRESQADGAGTLLLDMVKGRAAGVRITASRPR